MESRGGEVELDGRQTVTEELRNEDDDTPIEAEEEESSEDDTKLRSGPLSRGCLDGYERDGSHNSEIMNRKDDSSRKFPEESKEEVIESARMFRTWEVRENKVDLSDRGPKRDVRSEWHSTEERVTSDMSENKYGGSSTTGSRSREISRKPLMETTELTQKRGEYEWKCDHSNSEVYEPKGGVRDNMRAYVDKTYGEMEERSRGNKRTREYFEQGSGKNLGRVNKAPRRKEKEPPNYDGKTQLKDFLFQFEVIRKFNKWADEDAVFQLLMSCEGDALAVLCGNDVHPDGMTYEELVDLMRREFGPRECEEKYFMELLQRNQRYKN